jgi:hypothetical protein
LGAWVVSEFYVSVSFSGLSVVFFGESVRCVGLFHEIDMFFSLCEKVLIFEFFEGILVFVCDDFDFLREYGEVIIHQECLCVVRSARGVRHFRVKKMLNFYGLLVGVFLRAGMKLLYKCTVEVRVSAESVGSIM